MIVRPDTDNRCNYCLKSGHWKRDCPALRSKNKKSSNPAKFAGCAAPVPQVQCAKCGVSATPENMLPAGCSGCEVPECPAGEQHSSECADEQVSESFGPFITDGIISLVGDSNKKPVKILRDTGTTESFVSKSVLPFTSRSSTGKCVIIRIGL